MQFIYVFLDKGDKLHPLLNKTKPREQVQTWMRTAGGDITLKANNHQQDIEAKTHNQRTKSQDIGKCRR